MCVGGGEGGEEKEGRSRAQKYVSKKAWLMLESCGGTVDDNLNALTLLRTTRNVPYSSPGMSVTRTVWLEPLRGELARNMMRRREASRLYFHTVCMHTPIPVSAFT